MSLPQWRFQSSAHQPREICTYRVQFYSLDEINDVVHHNVAALFRYQVSDVVRERLERSQGEAQQTTGGQQHELMLPRNSASSKAIRMRLELSFPCESRLSTSLCMVHQVHGLSMSILLRKWWTVHGVVVCYFYRDRGGRRAQNKRPKSLRSDSTR